MPMPTVTRMPASAATGICASNSPTASTAPSRMTQLLAGTMALMPFILAATIDCEGLVPMGKAASTPQITLPNPCAIRVRFTLGLTPVISDTTVDVTAAFMIA
jgi:hypothetical protein